MQDNIYNLIRPTTFEDMYIYGKHIQTLKTMIREKALNHTILITGPTSYGKSTLADIIAKALNCEAEISPCNKCTSCEDTSMYVTRINAGDERGIEAMRHIAQEAQIRPLTARFGITLIDEAGGLTTDAQRALRDIAEHPPAHRYIILTTSEKNKIQADLRNRCTNIDIPTMSDSESFDFCTYVNEQFKKKLGIERTLTTEEIQRVLDFPDRNCRGIIDRMHTFITAGTITDEEGDVPITVVQLYNELVYKKKEWFEVQQLINALDVKHNEARTFMCNLASKTLVTAKEQASVVRAYYMLEEMMPDIHLATQKADLNLRLFRVWRAVNKGK